MTTTQTSAPATIPCPDPRCETFAYHSFDELAAHRDSGSCPVITGRARRFAEPLGAVRNSGHQPTANGFGGTTDRPVEGPTERQTSYLVALLQTKLGMDSDQVAEALRGVPTKRAASALIDTLKDLPARASSPAPQPAPAAPAAPSTPARPAKPTVDLSGVPRGTYDVEGQTIRIDAPDRGKWAGYIFAKRGATLETRCGIQRPGATEARTDDAWVERLQTLAADPAPFALAYGKRTGNCGICGRDLEDPVSVEHGIGPVCAERLGLTTERQAIAARMKAEEGA